MPVTGVTLYCSNTPRDHYYSAFQIGAPFWKYWFMYCRVQIWSVWQGFTLSDRGLHGGGVHLALCCHGGADFNGLLSRCSLRYRWVRQRHHMWQPRLLREHGRLLSLPLWSRLHQPPRRYQQMCRSVKKMCILSFLKKSRLNYFTMSSHLQQKKEELLLDVFLKKKDLLRCFIVMNDRIFI